MARLIPNESTWVGWVDTIADTTGLTAAASEVAGATVVTPWLISLNATSQGNTVPTPSFDTLFETTIPGTVSAQFSADFYRDDENDLAWDTLPRGTTGYFLISRFGGSGTDNLPIAADEVEVWPVSVTSRTMQNMASNQVLMFSVTCSVPVEPNEAATISA
jgi:hypothetical protein